MLWTISVATFPPCTIGFLLTGSLWLLALGVVVCCAVVIGVGWMDD